MALSCQMHRYSYTAEHFNYVGQVLRKQREEVNFLSFFLSFFLKYAAIMDKNVRIVRGKELDYLLRIPIRNVGYLFKG